MAAEPRIGTTIRRARERLRLRQQDVARKLGVSRTTVDAWENDRAYPRNSIGALEELLDVNLTTQQLTQLPVPEKEEEPEIPAHIQKRIDRLPPDEREYVIKLLTQPDDDPAGEAPA